jgi:galactofuranosylgalactofuranosylrhamnosyl-N-acetylglucosaminyl-diphospho-decaprenol beta-1,5/1,6-galactofuranosyltransferase
MTARTPGEKAAQQQGGAAAEDTKISDDASAQQSEGKSSMPANQVLQRVIMPRESDPLDVRPLYIDEPEHVYSHVSSRHSVKLPQTARVSFASYFNAFPASYWKRWTKFSEVLLRMHVRGTGRVDVYRSRPNGDVIHLQGQAVHSEETWTTVEFRVSLAPFGDGGWAWFDAFTDGTVLEISHAEWATAEPLPDKRLAVGITTFNRAADCVAALRALSEDATVLDAIDHVFVADQGDKLIEDHPDFVEAAEKLGGRLQVVKQGNLGGSGGFTRAMYESVLNTEVDYVVLMDDDIVLEPDSLLRLGRFAAACTQPVVVGGQMLNLQARATLHSMGEVVDFHAFKWGPAPQTKGGHDFAKKSLRKETWLHRRIDAGYNGWWMCLFPREVIEHIGLPMPMFIKWDDTEYGLRAANAGYPTVTLPGAGFWHMPWTDKDDTADWTVYFHVRNKLIAMALHSPENISNAVLKQAAKDAARRLFSMQYSAVALESEAIHDFLAGPDKLFELLPTALPKIQAIRKQYPDAQLQRSQQDLPLPSLNMQAAEPLLDPPTKAPKIAVRAVQALLHNVKDPAPDTAVRPQVNVPAAKALWFVLGNFDSATVSTPDGASVAFRKRDPKTFRELAARTVADYRKLVKEWPRVREQYRRAMPELTSVESWTEVYKNQ